MVLDVVWNGTIDREKAREGQKPAPDIRRSESSKIVGPTGAALKGISTEEGCEAPGCWHVARCQHYLADGRKGRKLCWTCGDRALKPRGRWSGVNHAAQ